MRVVKDEKGKCLLCGIIKEISDGRGKAAGRCINVIIENSEWNSDMQAVVNNRFQITFWDSDKISMKSRFEKAKFSAGDFISVLYFLSEEDAYKGNAVDLKKNGLWTLDDKRNIIIGTVTATKVWEKDNSKTTVATIPYNVWSKETGNESIFVNVRFNDKYRPMQERAYQMLSPRDGNYKKCIIECGSITKNAQGFYSAYGNSFEMLS